MEFELFQHCFDDLGTLIKLNYYEGNQSCCNELFKRDQEEADKALISRDAGGTDEMYASLLVELKTTKTQLFDLEKEKVSVQNDVQMLKDGLAELEKNHKKLLSKKKNAEHKCAQLSLETTMNPADAKIIDGLQKKYKSYKRITGIHWDFQAPENLSRGYITNKCEKTVSVFNMENSSEKAWSSIEKAGHGSWSKDKSSADKENAIPELLKDIQNIHLTENS